MRHIAALSLALLLAACTPADSLGTVTAHVTRVIDGDTVEVTGLDVPVRVVGIDSPELDTRAGQQAKRWAQEQLSGERVTLEQATDPDDDPYGRHLAHVRIGGPGGALYSVMAVRQGHAEVATYPPNTRYAEYLRTLEGE